MPASTFSSDDYFATQPAPATLQRDINAVREFVRKHKDAGRKVVLVTSGGTTVPLELNVVRFLDNFSAGTRGATSAEYFLKAGYAVIFMHRQFSLQPFSRHYSHTTNPFLDLLTIKTDAAATGSSTPEIAIIPEARDQLFEVLTAYRECHAQETLLTLTFVNVNDYLWLLRGVSEEMAVLKRSAIYYLAAAVSDFFLPLEKMSEHKIQSGKGNLVLEMDEVPKILRPLVSEWTPDGFIVSFKLETDPSLLIPKARRALERYGHQVVIGNELHRRKFEVVFVSRNLDTGPVHQDGTPATEEFAEEWLSIPQQDADRGREIEVEIIQRLVEMHDFWIAKRVVALRTPTKTLSNLPDGVPQLQ